MNELALFAGAGGGILASHLLGWKTVCAVEWEDYPRKVLLARQRDGILPRFPIWDDVQTFDGNPWSGRVNIVTGGFPCQDISVAGKGKGIDGERSGMWKHMARIIGEVRPQYAFVENSPMLTSRGLGRILGDLASMGYNAKWGVLGGSAVGNICEGERIWILASTPNSKWIPSLDIQKFKVLDSEESRRWQYTRAVCAALSQDDFSRIKRNRDAVANGMDRLKAIGNGQIPGVAAIAFKLLSIGV